MKTDTQHPGARTLAQPVAHAPVYPPVAGRTTFRTGASLKPAGRLQPGRTVGAAAAARVAREHTRGRHSG